MNQDKDKVRCTLYMAAGAYLLYITYSLIREFASTTINPSLHIAAIVLFAVGGIGFLVFGGINFRRITSQKSTDTSDLYNDEETEDASIIDGEAVEDTEEAVAESDQEEQNNS